MNMENSGKKQMPFLETESLRGAQKKTQRKYRICNSHELDLLLKFAPITAEETKIEQPILFEVRDFSSKLSNMVCRASNLPNVAIPNLPIGTIMLEIYNEQNPKLPMCIALYKPRMSIFFQVITTIEFIGSTEEAHKEAELNSKEWSNRARTILHAILNVEKEYERVFEKRGKGRLYLTDKFLKEASNLVVIPPHKRTLSNGKEISVKGYYRKKRA